MHKRQQLGLRGGIRDVEKERDARAWPGNSSIRIVERARYQPVYSKHNMPIRPEFAVSQLDRPIAIDFGLLIGLADLFCGKFVHP